MLLYIASLDSFGQEEYEKYYALADETRRRDIDRKRIENDKRRSLLGDALARRGISELLCIDERDIIFARTENGKPYCENAEVFFSVSHSKERVVCAVGFCGLGVDTEKIRYTEPRVMRACCIDGDFEYILGGEGESESLTDSQLKRFFCLWTAKEAYCKHIGVGVTGMKSISLSQIIDNCRFFENGEYITAVYSADVDFEIEIRDASI
ncbi:MAG: 4'-phosphopantetheinyl transferase superfamily protein [Clostridia bacterium]|nr:4'-phosphopantetheinyl transferase superfamily protein [Clostridia bacterium]